MRGQKSLTISNRSKKVGLSKKKKIIFIIGGLLLAVFVLFAFYFIRSAKKIKILFKEFKFASYKLSLKDLYDVYMNGLNATCTLNAQNFSSVDFTVSQISIDIFTIDNTPLASQVAPMSNPIVIKAKSNTLIPIEYNFSRAGIIALGKGGNFWTIMKDYVLKGVFGKKIILKGFVVANSINVPISETVEI